ncbi:MAG: FHA domain-containing protein [Pseudomonadales bacterium]
MTQLSDIQYFIELEGERIPIEGSMTLGRHLENDLVLAGEDVLDFHMRLEVSARGPRALPLGEASFRLNAVDLAEPVGLVPGDVLEVGQEQLRVDAAPSQPGEAENWALHRLGERNGVPVDDSIGVGRADDNALRLSGDHVSRYHAQLFAYLGHVWLRDLGSSNGTFVNGARIVGGCRLFHGDEVAFDTLRYQLIGRGGDLTPVNPHEGQQRPATPVPLSDAVLSGGTASTHTSEIEVVDAAQAEALLPVAGELPAETGAFLLGASEPVSGLTFRTPMGRSLIGRDSDCDLVIRDRTVSARHAELIIRPEGAVVTDLMSTNGSRVNGEQIRTMQLRDGDVLRLGNVSLVFKDVPIAAGNRPWLRNLQTALVAGSVVLALTILWLLW